MQNTQDIDDGEIEEIGLNFRPKTVSTRLDLKIAAAFFFAFAALYAVTSSFWAYPGEPSRVTAIIIGALPTPSPSDCIARLFYSLFALIGGSVNAARTCAVFSIVVSAAAAGLTYLLSSSIFRFAMQFDVLDASIEDGARRGEYSAVFGGAVATLALGFSAPFWVMSSRVNPYSLYLLAMLFCGCELLKYFGDDKLKHAVVLSAVYGLFTSQSPSFLQFLPLFAVGLIFQTLRSDRDGAKTLGLLTAVFGAAFVAGVTLSVMTFTGSEGYELMQYSGPGRVMEIVIQNLVNEAKSAFTNVGWLIIFGLVTLPFIAWISVVYRSLNGESGVPMRLLNTAITATVLVVLLNSRYSPWRMFGVRAEQVFSYTMVAMTAGYCAIVIRQQMLFLCESRPPEALIDDEDDEDDGDGAPAAAPVAAPPPADDDSEDGPDAPTRAERVREMVRQFGRVLRAIALGIVAILLLCEANGSFGDADARNTKFIRVYIDQVLDGLSGRRLLVTDGMFDDLFRLRARERSMDVTVVSLAEASTEIGRRLLRDRLDSATLRNALDLGPFSFLQEYIGADERAGGDLALTFFPDLWNIGPYRVYPDGMLFLGAPEDSDIQDPDGTGENLLTKNRDWYYGFVDKMTSLLDGISEKTSLQTQFLAENVRRRVGFVGNNLGYYMETCNRIEDALDLYRTVHRLDAGNVSSMLNLYSSLRNNPKLAQSGEVEKVKTELDEFRAALKRPIQIWELSRSQGYVASPEAFAFLGWSWAMSGQTPIALRTLDSALRDTTGRESRRMPILLAMANIHARRGDAEESEDYYTQVLQSNADNVSALVGLLHVHLSTGDTDKAEPVLARLRSIGVPQRTLLREEANLMIERGEIAHARRFINEMLKETPNDPDALLSLFTTYAAEYGDTATNSLERASIQKDLQSISDKLRDNPETRTFQGAIATGAYHLLNRDYADARSEFRIANKSTPGVPAILEQLLRLDYGLVDRIEARDHAMELLRMNPMHGFANYVMGSLALSEGKWDSARSYLERAERNWESALPKGDLAYTELHFGELDKAADLCRAAFKLNDRVNEIWDTYGMVLLEQDKANEAIDAFRQALKIKPDSYIAHLHLARAYLEDGQRDVARSTFDQLSGFENRFSGADKTFYNELWSALHGIGN